MMKKKGQLIIFLCFVSCISLGQAKNLDYYVNEGLRNSPLLKEYSNRVLSNSIDSQKLRATFKPQVSAISNNSYSPLVNGYGYDAALSNIASVNELINVNKAFVGRKNLQSQHKAISLQTDSLDNEKKISEQDLRRTITSQYITAFGDLQQLNFNKEVNRILRNQETILKQLAQNNIYKQSDYLAFLVTLQQQELQMKQIKIQFRLDFATLNYLCGIFDTSYAELETPDIILQNLPGLSSSVFFRRYTLDSLSLQNNITMLNYSYRPKLNSFANAGFSSSFLYQAYKNFGFGFGVDMSVPIYDGHQRKLQQQKIKLLQNTNADYSDFFTRQYGQQIAMLHQQLSSTQSLISDINDQIRYSEGLIDVNEKLLQTGDAKISDFIIAINNYLNAKNLLAQNSISRLQIINQLNYWNR